MNPGDGPVRLVVVGQGYVGLPLALRAVDAGFDVVGFDLDAHRVKQLAAGSSYVEDISDRRLAEALATGRYEPTDDPDRIAGFDVAVIDVPTPLAEGVPNLSYIEDAAAAPGRPPAARGDGGAGVDQLSRHHRGAGRTDPGGRLGAAGRP